MQQIFVKFKMDVFPHPHIAVSWAEEKFIVFAAYSTFIMIMYNCGLGKTVLVVDVDTIECNT